MTAQNKNDFLVYVGTYTGTGSKGIYIYRLDGSSGDLTLLGTGPYVESPSFLATDRAHRHLYAANETGEFGGKWGGSVSAFSIAPRTGALTLVNQQPSRGTSPCHVSVDRTGQWVLVANYGSGHVSLYPVGDDGHLGEATDCIQHEAPDVDPKAQKAPHAHSITPDPANRFVFAADLGLDRIMIYRLDLDGGKLVPNEQPWVSVKAGAGPRHFVFHPSLKTAYVINELDNTVIAFAYEEARGRLTEIQTISALPEGFSGTSYCADVHISPSGAFLYGSNRGHDSLAIFAIDQETGKLTGVGHEPTRGKNPRNFAIDPTGAFLLAANQDTETIVSFGIDGQTGKLRATGHVTQVPTPVCVTIIPNSL
ncbi:MAG: lactonase family protein [Candidatus Latescibacterota bacterium]